MPAFAALHAVRHGGHPLSSAKIAPDDRELILTWGRTTGLLREVVQEYRFERRQGAPSSEAHVAASKLLERADPSLDDPLTFAGVMIEWAEREHRAWFWRCCRDHHLL